MNKVHKLLIMVLSVVSVGVSVQAAYRGYKAQHNSQKGYVEEESAGLDYVNDIKEPKADVGLIHDKPATQGPAEKTAKGAAGLVEETGKGAAGLVEKTGEGVGEAVEGVGKGIGALFGQ